MCQYLELQTTSICIFFLDAGKTNLNTISTAVTEQQDGRKQYAASLLHCKVLFCHTVLHS